MRGIGGGAGIPRREIDTELHVIFLAGLGDEFGDVNLWADAAAVRHAEVCACRGPEAETVVVLTDDDDARHAGALHGRYPLVAVGDGLRGVVGGVRLDVVAPLLVDEGVVAVVRETIEFHFHPVELALRRNGEYGRRRVVRIWDFLLLEQLLRRGGQAYQAGSQEAE